MTPVPEFPGYRDVEPLAEGGLGRLYRATRASTGGTVAIKELREMEFASEVSHRARRELDALLKLKGHPYVVSVEEIIDGPVGPALVMEYAPGGSLHDRVLHGPLSGPEVVLAGQHVVSALAAAHECGIIHRDVKPHNLLVGAFGQVKVCDFGIAAIVMGPSGRTQTQAFTLAYASPEELDGEVEVGPPADVYSFAATWVHLMTGRRPTFRDRLSGASMDISLPTGAIEPTLRPVLVAIRAGLAHQPEDRPTMDDLRVVFDNTSAALGDRRLQRLTPIAAPVETQDEAPTISRPLTSVVVALDPPVVAASNDEEEGLTVRRESVVVSSDRPLDASPRSRRKWIFAACAALLVMATGVAFVVLPSDEPPGDSQAVGGGSADSLGTAVANDGRTELATTYAAAGEALRKRYSELDTQYFGSGFFDSSPIEAIPQWCADTAIAERSYWDMLLHAQGTTTELNGALGREREAQGDLVAALDECRVSSPELSAVNSAFESVLQKKGLAQDAGASARRLLGISSQ